MLRWALDFKSASEAYEVAQRISEPSPKRDVRILPVPRDRKPNHSFLDYFFKTDFSKNDHPFRDGIMKRKPTNATEPTFLVERIMPL